MFRAILKCFLASAIIYASGLAQAGGLIGDIVQGVGRAVGVKPIEKLGQEMDNGHRDIKNAIPPYKAIEEASSGIVRQQFLETCNYVYKTITSAVIAQCSNWNGRLDDQDLIRNAIDSLISSGLFRREEFDDVQIRWCPLINANGIAPEHDRIYLNISAKSDNPTNIAALLAHEMVHIRQYRDMGADKFKCEYSRKYLECGGCQDDRHTLEREAYNFENAAYGMLDEYGWKMCNESDSEYIWVAYSSAGLRQGWRQIGKGQCSMLLPDLDSQYVYYYAEGSSGRIWSGDTDLCVHPRYRFISGDDAICPAPFEMRPFLQVDTGDLQQWTTTISD